MVYRLFNPRVPVIICSKFGDDIAAMPANSCSSVSDSPPLISVAIKRDTKTSSVLRKSSFLSINWLNFKAEDSSSVILRLSSAVDKNSNHDKLGFYGIPYSIIGQTPVLRQACAYAICGVVKRLRTGDHELFIAKVIKAMAIRDFTNEGYWRFKSYKPILYVGSIRRDPFVTIG